MEKFHRKIFDNGITLVAEHIPYLRSVTVAFWVNGGSRIESNEESGMTHFIEHMLFKGTKTRTAKQIAEEFDSIGGHLDAFTSKEQTCFYAKVTDEHFKKAFSILADLVLNPLFSREDLNKEKNVIKEEISMYIDNPDEYIHDLFMKALWEKHSLGKPILGDSKVIVNCKKEEITGFYNKQYVPSNIVISVVGNIGFSKIEDEINRYFNSSEEKANISKIQATPVLSAKHIVEFRKLEQVHLCLGAEALPVIHKDRYVQYILHGILGSNMSSRLFQKIREEKALAYSIASFFNSYNDAGYWVIYAGTGADKVKELIDSIFVELDKIKKHFVTKDELRRAKDQINNSFLLSMEDTIYRMVKLAKHEMYFKRYFTVDEVLADIDKVSIEDVNRLANDLIDKKKLAAVFLGPLKQNQIPKFVS